VAFTNRETFTVSAAIGLFRAQIKLAADEASIHELSHRDAVAEAGTTVN